MAQVLSDRVYVEETEPVKLSREEHGERFCLWAASRAVVVRARGDGLHELTFSMGVPDGTLEAELAGLGVEIVEHRDEFGQEVCRLLDCPLRFVVSSRVLFGVETSGLPQVWERDAQAGG